MRRLLNGAVWTLVIGLWLAVSVPSQAVCWGSLHILSRTTRLRTRCPTPTLTKTWRVACYDGCGYTTGTFATSLVGFGECFKGPSCSAGTTCLPVFGGEIRSFNPPSLSASMVNRGGYYASPPCALPSCRSVGVDTIRVECDCDRDADPRYCAQNDPVIISLGDHRYRLTDRAGGVVFDLGDTGTPAQVPWTHPSSDEAFLALDRDGNGTVDTGRELFGDVTPQHPTDAPNGFLALALFDDVLSGGNEDGRLSDADEIYPQLRLWRDENHNGFSEPGELLGLAQAGLEWIALDYTSSPRIDRHGNAFRFRADSGWSGGESRRVWNVFLVAD